MSGCLHRDERLRELVFVTLAGSPLQANNDVQKLEVLGYDKPNCVHHVCDCWRRWEQGRGDREGEQLEWQYCHSIEWLACKSFLKQFRASGVQEAE